MTLRSKRTLAIVAIAAVVLAAAGYTAYRLMFAPITITAQFDSATAVYEGDDVRVAGMTVGSIASIEPQGESTRLVLDIDRDVEIPADAKAVIVAQSLVAARFVQLTPSYSDSVGGPTMHDGDDIPLDRTAVPMEWDDIKEQLKKLADSVGPNADSENGTLATFIDSAAGALDGNGQKLKDMLTQLSGSAKILSDKRTDIFDTVKNLQIFVEALSGSGEQIVQFSDRLASVSSVLDESRTDLDAALTNLSSLVVNLQRFVAENRDVTSASVDKLRELTQVLVDNSYSLQQVLHVAPTALSNYQNIYNPSTGAAQGAFTLNNFSNPIQAICSAIGSIENATAEEGAKLCAQYLGPVLSTLSINSLPVPINPITEPTVPQDRLVYTDPKLVPSWVNNEPAPEASAVPVPSLDQLLAPLTGGVR